MPRQRLYRTPAVVLKRMDLGEADRIVTLYSRDHGKIRAVAKGVRKSTSRSSGHLEPFTQSDVLFAVGRELDVVSQAETLTSFRAVRENLDLIASAYYVAEVVDRMTEDKLENHEVYDALLDALTGLEEQSNTRLVLVAFLIRALHAFGFRPELQECVGCRDELQPGRNYFSAFLGGALCPRCGPSQPSARPIETDVLKLLRYVQRTDGQAYVSVSAPLTEAAEYVLRDYAERIIERRLRAPALMDTVQKAASQAGL